MKKRVIATLIGAIIMCNCFLGDIVSFAVDVDDEMVEETDTTDPIDTEDIEVVEPTDPVEEEDITEETSTEDDVTADFSLDDFASIAIKNKGLTGEYSEADWLAASLMVTPATTDSSSGITADSIVESMSVKKGGQDLKSGDEVSLSDGFTVTYNFKQGMMLNCTDDDADYLTIKAGETYYLPKIDVTAIKLAASTTEVKLRDGRTLGNMTIGADGSVALAITLTDEDQVLDSFDPFTIDFSLNEAAIGDAEEYDLKLFGDGGASFKLTISDNKAEAPTIKTEASGTGDKILWTSTITNASNPKHYDSGYTFIGVINNEQVLDPNSVKFNGNPITPEISTDASGVTTIKYDIPASDINTVANGTAELTYETSMDFLANGGAAKAAASKSATNDVKIVAPGGTETITDAKGSKDFAATKKAPNVGKVLNNADGKFTNNKDKDQGEGDWTITVSTHDYAVKNLTIYDELIPGDDTTNFVLDPDSVVVKKGGTVLTEGTDYEIVKTPGTKDGKSYSWYVKFASTSSNTDYEITYKTLIKDYKHYLRTNHANAPSNKAFMTYEYEKGSGTWVPVDGPSMSVAGKITTNAGISVTTGTASKYDPATHQITWTVTVNQEKQELTNASIIDGIPSDQTFVSSNIKDVVSTATVTENGNEVTFDIGDAANEKTIVFEVVTKLTDEQVDFWSKNVGEKTYKNPFTLKADELDAEGLKVEANCSCQSKVIGLTAGNYDYGTHEIEYVVDVNDNQMLMEGITVSDDLESLGLELVDDSVKLNGTSLSKGGAGAHYTYEDGKLTVYADDVTAAQVGKADAKSQIKFTAKVTDEKLQAANENTQEVKINNTAKLVTNDIPSGETAAAETTFTNNIVLKGAVVNTANFSANYTVTFNANQLELPDNLEIRDTLGASMDLDVSSVKVYRGTVDASTGAVTNSGVEETGCDITTSVDANGRTVLSIKLPKIAGNTNPYYLTYTATAVDFDKNDYNNSVYLLGYGGKNYSTVNAEAKALAVCGASASTAPKIILKNLDKDDDSSLGGSTFVIKDSKGNVVRTLTTKADGTAKVLGGKIKNGETYTVTQQTVKNGYVIESDPVSVTVTGNKGEVTIKNPKKNTKLNVYTRADSETGDLINGAKVTVTRKDTATGNVISEDNWDSKTDNPKELTLYWGSAYVIKNPSAPAKYKTDDTTTIKVSLDENGDVIVEEIDPVNGNKRITDGVANVVCKTKDAAVLAIDNLSASQKAPIEGTKFVVSTSATPTSASTIDTWVSDGTTKEVVLPEGEYYIIQQEAPTGFDKAATKRVRVNPDKSVDIYDDDTASFVPFTESKLAIENAHNGVKKSVTFSPESMGMDPDMFKSMKFALYRVNKATGVRELITPKNSDTDEKLEYDLDYQDEYEFVPEETIEGYDPVKPITLKAVGKTVYDAAGNPQSTEDGLKMKTLGDNTFKSATLTDIGKSATPKLTPVETAEVAGNTSGDSKGGSSSSGSSSSGSYGGATGTVADPLKETNIIMGADLTEDPANAAGPRLAKTGGFIGTLIGYLAAIAMILGGFYLVFGKRKRVK